MELAITDAKARLTDLVRRAEAGEEVVITRHGHAVARLVARSSAESRAKVISVAWARAVAKVTGGLSAARSQDFLYDDEGFPR
ncbi:MAG: type II toxin-antitoxin system prevent-host-death family antitoxin [Boseongicola sp.]|nr:type II toxin-antitoxin system prevent-host-death family antitoxin [Boseongicola sp.]